jgi:hypothetical protein
VCVTQPRPLFLFRIPLPPSVVTSSRLLHLNNPIRSSSPTAGPLLYLYTRALARSPRPSVPTFRYESSLRLPCGQIT